MEVTTIFKLANFTKTRLLMPMKINSRWTGKCDSSRTSLGKLNVTDDDDDDDDDGTIM